MGSWVGYEDVLEMLSKEWSDQNDKPLSELSPGSSTVGIWKCERGHVWMTSVHRRHLGKQGCPYCGGMRPIKGETDFETRFPAAALEWDYEVNGDLRPCDVAPYSRTKVGWKCSTCGHRWLASPERRTKGHGCPVCGRRVPGKDRANLAVECPLVAADWDYDKNDLSPYDYRPHSNEQAWWKCPFGHSWHAQINSRTRKNKPSGCPYCAGKAVLEGYNDLTTTDPVIASEWSDMNGDLLPTTVSRNSHKSAYWTCENGHTYKAIIANRVSGHGCPYCAGKSGRRRNHYEHMRKRKE